MRERLRGQLVEAGSEAFADPAVFADVEGVMRAAVSTPEHTRPILPELRRARHLAPHDQDGVSIAPGHRCGIPILFVKQRVLMPLLRWLAEYSRDNFERQRRINHVLFACA